MNNTLNRLSLNQLRFFSIILATLCFYLMGKDFFLVTKPDGFLKTFYDFVNNPLSELNYELKYVHLLRYLICFPFNFRADLGLPSFVDSLIYASTITIFVRKKIDNLLYFIPLFVSIRTGYCICSLYGVWSLFESNEESYIRTSVSFILSILSSGVLLCWYSIFFLFHVMTQRFKVRPILFIFFTVCTISILSSSVIHKFFWFNDLASTKSTVEIHIPTAGKKKNSEIRVYHPRAEEMLERNTFQIESTSTGPISFFYKIINFLARSNLLDPFIVNDYKKGIFYLFYLAFCLFCASVSKSLHPKWKVLFIRVVLLGFLLEGLPIISFSFIYLTIFIHYLEHRKISFFSKNDVRENKA
jgi:hypothetical protein